MTKPVVVRSGGGGRVKEGSERSEVVYNLGLANTSLREPDLQRILAQAYKYENNCTTPLLRAQNIHSAWCIQCMS